MLKVPETHGFHTGRVHYSKNKTKTQTIIT